MPIIYFLCAIAIIKGIVHLLYYRNKDKKYYKAKGIVTDNYLDRYMDSVAGYDHYYPIIEYTDKDGTTWKATASEYNPDRPMYTIGQKVNLLISPDDPTAFLFDEKADKLLIPLVWIGIGVIGIIMGIIIDW